MKEYVVKQFVVNEENPLGTFVVQPVESEVQHLLVVDVGVIGAIYWDYDLCAYIINCADKYVKTPWENKA